MKKMILGFVFLVSVLTSCISEQALDNGAFCTEIASQAGIVLKINSKSPLPKNLRISFNDSSSVVADECPSDSLSKITFNEGRTQATLSFILKSGSEEYESYLNSYGEPIKTHFNVQISKRENCLSNTEFIQERLNIFLQWKKASQLGLSCGEDSYQGISQFTFQSE